MRPKEKAIELVNKFMFTSFNIQENTYDFKFKLLIQAKQCALIAVEEMITEIEEIVNPSILGFRYRYWKLVKQEIEKL